VFIEIKGRIDQPEVMGLLYLCGMPDMDRVEKTVQDYKQNADWKLYGIEEDGLVLGLIGYRRTDADQIEIMHLSVRPDSRGYGYGRGLILEMLSLENPQRIYAETDEDAVEFFRNIGFTIRSLGMNDLGAERFQCIYDAELTEEE
jgi:N-acetylglutamate synthase-like GNAT family acetyltransferase